MSYNITNEDLRSFKTKRALYAAMSSLIKKMNFKKITIKGICEQASISRAAFYAHFLDKYDLLKHWIIELYPKYLHCGDSYEQIEQAVNFHANKNMVILKNLVDDADNETLEILFDFIGSTINLTMEGDGKEEASQKNIVLSNFFAGGMVTYLSWQIKNKFPSEVPPMNRYLYEIICEFQNWQSEEDKEEAALR